jgi:hypothetical protein
MSAGASALSRAARSGWSNELAQTVPLGTGNSSRQWRSFAIPRTSLGSNP